MPNFFTDNPDLLFHFDHLALEEVVALVEHDYQQASVYDDAPTDYADAVQNYREVLTLAGQIAADFIAPRAAQVDVEGNRLENDRVIYATGIREALDRLGQAELMGVTLPRKYGGLNFPTTIYIMAIEMISRADASLMNLYGLQDIAETINRFGNEAQREQFLPQFASGACTGAMVLTEPDAGSDLQAVKLQAYEDAEGTWRLRGVKRFITNGCGDILLVLARSEPGSKDGRGLSLFVCRSDETVKVRRIEHKLGIHGSPTCELQFNDTPAQLVGKRKFGLIKYVMDLMNGARLGVAAQALGIAQAAYEEAVRYARARRQFGQVIANLPVVANMLIDMRVALESNRSLLYAVAQWVDRRDKYGERAAQLRERGESSAEAGERAKQATQVAALLTPLVKYVLSESANKITYDALQIHGGAGYMREFPIERLTRDARVTNIYEGTSQLQIVAASGPVLKDLLGEHFAAAEAKEYPGHLSGLAAKLQEIRRLFLDSREVVVAKADKGFEEVAARELVDMYGYLFVGYLLLEQAQVDSRKVFIAKRYIVSALAEARKRAELITGDNFADVIHADKILS
ncbi:MAG: acyl-CoA dehydrogenase family protein [Proteobacteria bacterium]|nr:acyl-CoA dehydrogenase family protein [Pseudomonadota bacterium]